MLEPLAGRPHGNRIYRAVKQFSLLPVAVHTSHETINTTENWTLSSPRCGSWETTTQSYEHLQPEAPTLCLWLSSCIKFAARMRCSSQRESVVCQRTASHQVMLTLISCDQWSLFVRCAHYDCWQVSHWLRANFLSNTSTQRQKDTLVFYLPSYMTPSN